MLFYQAAIIVFIFALLFLLVIVFHIRHRVVVGALVLSLSVLGAAGILGVQNYFGSHIYAQKVDIPLVRRLSQGAGNQTSFEEAFSDYHQDITDNLITYQKTYTEKSGGVSSEVKVSVMVYPNKDEADRLFTASQRFYDNKNFAPVDAKHSLRQKELTHRYITTFIKTQYSNYTDFVYLPSRMSSYSYIFVQNKNAIISISERAPQPVSNKDPVLKDLVKRLDV
ncbi:MAG TPA: hypothetical protein DEP42_00220 [Ruminococcaceae bacterium]|nr:hypothetical protein [Oscillospiraceae bacterium]